MKKKSTKTTIFGWIAAIGLLLSQADSPIAPLLPPVVKQVGGIVAVVGAAGLGTMAKDDEKHE